MTETTTLASSRPKPIQSRDWESEAQTQYTESVLLRHKQQGQDLAVKARWGALAIIAVFLIFLNPEMDVLYYHFILACLALNAYFMRRVARVGLSRIELALLFIDLALMTAAMVMPNPLSQSDMPIMMQYRQENFLYFFVILAAGTLAYSWRTVIAIGTWTTGLWLFGAVMVWWLATPSPELAEASRIAFDGYPDVAKMLDPNSVNFDRRVQEVVVFFIVAATLGLSVRRFNGLLRSNARLERERANLSRYFSPNVVEDLSQNDEPLKQIRTHDVAVLFIDIVDFTKFAASREPHEVIRVLRDFHARMEAEVFRFNGTLDKYLGDGLMATFGTPLAGDNDASHALACARSMNAQMDQWNTERRQAGEPVICAGIGVHYGSAVLGDIGANRLEFAVIGNTVNVSSRLETLTRTLNARIAISDEMCDQVKRETQGETDLLDGLTRHTDQIIRGIDKPMTIWTLGRAARETT